MSEVTETKMFECEKCGIRFEKYEEAVEHEKNCKADEIQTEKVEEVPIKFEKEEDIIKKIVDDAEKEIQQLKSGQKAEQKEEENLNTNIEQELDDATDMDNEIKEVIAPAEEIKEEKQKIKEEIISEPTPVIEQREEKIEAPQAQKEEKIKCTLCGLCRMSCPAYSIMLNEAVSPRGKAMLIKKDMASNFIYLCTLCKACENACVLKDIDITQKVVEFRKEMVKLGIKTEANEKMVDNIRKYGNAIGKIEPGKKVTLWCC
jgi:glycolate oxidase